MRNARFLYLLGTLSVLCFHLSYFRPGGLSDGGFW